MGAHPRTRLRTVQVNTPSDGGAGALRRLDWAVGRGVLVSLDIVIPAGHAGLTGLAIEWGGRIILPYERGEYIVGDDDEIQVELDLWIQDRITIVTYNLDVFAHSHYLRAYVQDLAPSVDLLPVAPAIGGVVGPGPFEPIPPADLTPVADVWGGADVTAEEFLAELQGLLSSFLAELQATLGSGGGVGGGGLEPPPPIAPVLVGVPSVVGMQASDAEAALDAAGLAWTEADVDSTQPAGTVVAQAPAGGAQVDPSTTTVALEIASAPAAPAQVRVPNVVGMQQTPAANAIRGAGLKVAIETVVRPKGTRFQVIRQQPAAGAMVETGSTVTLTSVRTA